MKKLVSAILIAIICLSVSLAYAVLNMSDNDYGIEDPFHYTLTLTYGKADDSKWVAEVDKAAEAEKLEEEENGRTGNTDGL